MIIQIVRTDQGMLACLECYSRATPEQIKAFVEGATQAYALLDICSCGTGIGSTVSRMFRSEDEGETK